MSTANIETNQWLESPDRIATVHTEQWSFSPVVTILTAEMETDQWEFVALPVAGGLPVFSPSIVTSVTRVKQDMAFPQFVTGGLGLGDNYALFKKGTEYAISEFSIWRSPMYRINKDFDVLKITFPLHSDIGVGTSIIPKLYFDDGVRTSTGTTINSTNYSKKLIRLTSKNFDNSVHGQANFFLELQFRGSGLSVVAMPVKIELEIHE